MRSTILITVQTLWVVVECFVVPSSRKINASEELIPKIFSRDDDPTDFGWIKRWAAVGDSFTAGIGSGAPLGNPIKDPPGNNNWYCSRYDTSYPMIINDALGPSVEDFQFVACSGDRTGGIYKQIQEMEGELDLVIMTAGGNDLCLASMIEKCVFKPFDGEEGCTSVIDIAEDNLDLILKPNLEELMDALKDKMNDDGIVVFNGYAQFFNTEDESCSEDQNWILLNLLGQEGLTLTIDRRKRFNELVVKINNIIEEVVEETRKDSSVKYKVGFSNWDVWPSEAVPGQFCDPSSSGHYPDSNQPDLQFFKPDTYVDEDTRDELKRRSDGNDWAKYKEVVEEVRRRNMEDDLYNSLLYKSQNPQAEAKHKLDRRAPSPPKCPGDTDDDIQPPSIGLPDFIGKNFHPNELGHYTIASFALQTMIDIRAEVLEVEPPSCEPVDKFTCWQGTGSKAYTGEPLLNDNYESFCDDVESPSGELGWSSKETYFSDTPDEFELKITLADNSEDFDRDVCKDSFNRIINGCDGNDEDNPMDWKFGGEWVRGKYTYQVNPQRDNRPWPVIQEPGGRCEGWYHGVWSSYEIEGYGFSGYDFGQYSLLPAAKDCVGGGITSWEFKYYDEPTEDDYEWKATFSTPIWVRARCFDNNKVQFDAEGFTNGCEGND